MLRLIECESSRLVSRDFLLQSGEELTRLICFVAPPCRLADMSSRRAEVGWSTHGHSGVDVNLYMYPFDPTFHGSKENTEVRLLLSHTTLFFLPPPDPLTDVNWSCRSHQIGAFIASHLSLDLEGVTARLNDADVDRWFHWETTSGKEKGGQQKKKKRGVKHFHQCQCTS